VGLISSKPKQNLIINGAMEISQRFGTNSITSIASSTYMTDRFQYVKSGAMVHNAQQIVSAPTEAQSGVKLTNSLNLAITTPDTSIAAGDLCIIQQKIEGYNFEQIARVKTFTLSFWVLSTFTGTYCVAFQNSGGDRSYVAEYTINSAGTWEYKTITVNSPTPSAGTWNYTNGIGLNVIWTLAAGSTYQTTSNSWQTGNFIATSNQINGVNTGANDFRLTGVMLNEGSSAQPFRLFGNGIEQEVAACQRYYEKSYNLETAPGQELFRAHTVNHYQPISFRVFKRSNGLTITFYNSASGVTGSWRDSSAVADRSIGSADGGQKGFGVLITSSVDGNIMNGQWTADSEI
jgi:hypothetical protein